MEAFANTAQEGGVLPEEGLVEVTSLVTVCSMPTLPVAEPKGWFGLEDHLLSGKDHISRALLLPSLPLPCGESMHLVGYLSAPLAHTKSIQVHFSLAVHGTLSLEVPNRTPAPC